MPPHIILVRPQMGENIGATARAMANFNLWDLLLVGARDGWPNPKAYAMCSGADAVLDRVHHWDSLDEALSGYHFVAATSARMRDIVKPVVTPAQLAKILSEKEKKGLKTAIIFGAERTGLENHEVSRAHILVRVPVNPDFSSLNLAQSVLLCAYEWFQYAQQDREENPVPLVDDPNDRPASCDEMNNFFSRLETFLIQSGFLFPPEKRPAMMNNIRALWMRATPTAQEIRTFHGIISALVRMTPPL